MNIYLLAKSLIGSTANDIFYSICLTIDGIVYSLICWLFKIFMALAGARIINNEFYKDIVTQVYIIIGVVMLFVLGYAIIKMIIDPDKLKDEKIGGPGLLKSIVIAVLGIALVPVVFNLLYQAQALILEQDIIAKIFFRRTDATFGEQNVGPVNIEYNEDDGTTNTETIDISQYKYNTYDKEIGGGSTATSIWQGFFHVAPDFGVDKIDEIVGDPHKLYVEAAKAAGWSIFGALAAVGGVVLTVAGAATSWAGVGVPIAIAGAALCAGSAALAAKYKDDADQINKLTNGKEMTLNEAYAFSAATGKFEIYIIFKEEIIDKGSIQYLVPFALIGGCVALYIFFTFCIDMAVRAAKLAYYQIIAPIPMILQIIPKFKDSFNTYVKEVMSTFVGVFIRMAVVYIIVYIIGRIATVEIALSPGNDLDFVAKLLAIVMLIMGLLIFAKEAPGLFSKLFNLSDGKIDLGIKDKLADGGLFGAAALGSSIIKSGFNGYSAKYQAMKDRPGGKFGALVNALGSGIGGAVGAGVRSLHGMNIFGRQRNMPRSFEEARRRRDEEVEKTKKKINDKINRQMRNDLADGITAEEVKGIRGLWHKFWANAGLRLAGNFRRGRAGFLEWAGFDMEAYTSKIAKTYKNGYKQVEDAASKKVAEETERLKNSISGSGLDCLGRVMMRHAENKAIWEAIKGPGVDYNADVFYDNIEKWEQSYATEIEAAKTRHREDERKAGHDFQFYKNEASANYDLANDIQTREIKRIDKGIEKIKSSAVSISIASGVTGCDNEAIGALREWYGSNNEILSQHIDDKIVYNGRETTIGAAVSEIFGSSFLSTGQIDFERYASSTLSEGGSFEGEYDGGKFSVRKEGGVIKYTVDGKPVGSAKEFENITKKKNAKVKETNGVINDPFKALVKAVEQVSDPHESTGAKPKKSETPKEPPKAKA